MEIEHKSALAEQFVELSEHLNRRNHDGRLDALETLDMTIPQIRTLDLLKRTGPLRMGNIADHLGRALSATTTVVDRLVERELVVRASDHSDRRVVVCELTENGHRAVEALWRIDPGRLQRVADLLDFDQLAIVVRALQLLKDAHGKIDAEDGPAAQPQPAERDTRAQFESDPQPTESPDALQSARQQHNDPHHLGAAQEHARELNDAPEDSHVGSNSGELAQ